jgi:hypothetical protein
MVSHIYDKTDKGREEIATRKYQLPPKLRTLLVMIDGRHSLESLLKHFAALGLGEDNVKELVGQGYIALAAGPAADEPEPEQARAPASARARMLARTRNQAAAHSGVEADRPAIEPDSPAVEPAPEVMPATNAERFRALYEFYNQTIKSTIGLRGFALQLKVEKAVGIEDFRALRLQYLEAVLKAKGREMALSLRERLDQLLGGKPAVDDFELPAD